MLPSGIEMSVLGVVRRRHVDADPHHHELLRAGAARPKPSQLQHSLLRGARRLGRLGRDAVHCVVRRRYVDAELQRPEPVVRRQRVQRRRRQLHQLQRPRVPDKAAY